MRESDVNVGRRLSPFSKFDLFNNGKINFRLSVCARKSVPYAHRNVVAVSLVPQEPIGIETHIFWLRTGKWKSEEKVDVIYGCLRSCNNFFDSI